MRTQGGGGRQLNSSSEATGSGVSVLVTPEWTGDCFNLCPCFCGPPSAPELTQLPAPHVHGTPAPHSPSLGVLPGFLCGAREGSATIKSIPEAPPSSSDPPGFFLLSLPASVVHPSSLPDSCLLIWSSGGRPRPAHASFGCPSTSLAQNGAQ